MPTAAEMRRTAGHGPTRAACAGLAVWPRSHSRQGRSRNQDRWVGGFTLVEEGISDAFRQSPGPEVERARGQPR